MEAIVVVARDWAIGREGDQLVYLSADLKRFKELTMGHPVILGRKTLATFPGGRPLKGRRNLILSATPGYGVEGAEVCPDVATLLAHAPQDAFVIGGESVYRALLPHCDTVHVTMVDHVWPADRFFPDLDGDPAWTLAERSAPQEEKGLTFRYLTYRKVQ